MSVETPTPRDVHTTLTYYQPRDQPQDQIPYLYVGWEPPTGVPQNNVVKEPYPVVVHDVRGRQDAFGLDITGFQWVKSPSVVKDPEFVDQQKIETVYYDEVEDILKKYTSAKRVFIFHHTIRRKLDPDDQKHDQKIQPPAHTVHADQTFAAAEACVRKYLPNDAERLLKGRYQIINVWRPIANTVAHEPLAVADSRSVDFDADLVTTRLVFPDREGSIYHISYNPRHEWYYLADQTPEEVILFKCFDSDVDKGRLVPHSAFLDKTSPADAPQRQSIEVRALVFDTE